MSHDRADRRRFIETLIAAPLAAGAAGRPRTQEAPKPAPGEAPPAAPVAPADGITEATVAEAAKLAAVDFPEDERKRIAAGAKETVRLVEGLRKHRVPNDLPPATVFRLAAPATIEGGGVHALPDGDVERPKDARDLAFLPVTGLARLLRARTLRSEELTRLCLDRLRQRDADLHGVVTLTEDLALAQARAADAELDAGRWRGPLHGVPYGLKDLFAVRGHPTTWGARPLATQTVDADAAVYERLRDAGAVLAAKLSLGALAMGDLWFGGRTRNPFKPDEGSSGSSAGSAAAVAAGLLPFAIGTETLGSIVSPCTRCRATGLRPTFGRISRHGAMVLCWTMDKVGPIARTVRDAALVFDALRGFDARDASTVEAPFSFRPTARLEGRRIGFVPASFEGRRPEHDRAVLDALRDLGATLVETALPDFDAGPLRLILDAEAAAAFDDFTRDGSVRQLDGQGPGDWPDSFRRSRFITAIDYLRAQRLRTRLVAAWDAWFADFEVLVSPSQRGGTLLPTNLTGHPACVLPNRPASEGSGSITFLARPFQEGPILEVAAAYQEATGFHLDRPSE